MLVVTQDPRLAEICDRTITLVDGVIVSDVVRARLPQLRAPGKIREGHGSAARTPKEHP